MRNKFDNVILGTSLGILLPCIVMLLIYKFQYGFMKIDKFISLIIEANIYSELISLSVIANLLVFFLFIWTNNYYSARGVLFATFLFAGLIIYFKI